MLKILILKKSHKNNNIVLKLSGCSLKNWHSNKISQDKTVKVQLSSLPINQTIRGYFWNITSKIIAITSTGDLLFLNIL